ncbi:helicase-related protein [Fodinibius sp.]|uniref:helicase-related protein n=1 Tax=Fodinibius sp. TaxID=1872440 RepID=UPI002ACE8BA7|nr:helicase-related protein [Fodinibius sp.]MDZ7660469.1 helicase-related protein [Fodinibius sp.]
MPITKTNIDQISYIAKDDFDHWLGDWDSDGIVNIDDPNPLTPGDTSPVSEAELAPQIEAVIETKNRYIPALKSVMNSLIKMNVALVVKGRIKEVYSTLGKLIRKRFPFTEKIATKAGEKYTTGLTDVAGCMAIVETQSQVDTIVERIQSGALGEVWEHEDKYENPANGYRAHHFILIVDGEFPVEIQVKTKRMSMISAASHHPYKVGQLNGALLEQLTDMAWKADQGDEQAAKEIDPKLTNLDQLEKQLTLRGNPGSELEELQTAFELTTRKLALAFQLDKFPSEYKEEALGLFRAHGQIIGVDFDGVFNSASTEQPEPPKQPKKESSQSTFGFTDIDLSGYAPIKLTASERRKANESAIAVLQKEDRAITNADIEVLRSYTGAGGLGYTESTEQTKRGLLNEHYTSYPVVQLIWNKLQKMGVAGGNILEPGSGVGNFAGFLPDRQKYRMIMVERSAISSRIARLLYPMQTVRHENFADTDLSLYNLTGVVGNVPFGDLKIHTQRDPLAPLSPRIHDYFILKSLDALKPGGFLTVITSTGTMDKKDPSIRQAMIARAKFVGAYRLPSTAFKDNADTTVTTDILFFQKYSEHAGERHPDQDSKLNRLFAQDDLIESQVSYNGETYTAFYNPYYKEHPDHVLGEHIQGHHVQFYSRMGVKGELNSSAIDKVLADGLTFPYPLPDEMPLYNIPDDGIMLDLPRNYHPGNIVFHEGKFYERQRRFYKRLTLGGGSGLTSRISSACQLLDAYEDYITALAQETPEKEALRAEFKELLATHIETYGIPDEDEDLRKVFKFDNRLYKLTTLVKRDPLNGELVHADIIDADSMFNRNYVPAVKDSDDLAELAMFGRSIGETLDMDFYQSVYKGGTATKEELEKALESHPDFYWNPVTETYEFRYQYLAGNVREKLQLAQENELEKNIKALEEVVPEWIDVYNITVDPQHIFTYLPAKAIEEWIAGEMNYDRVEIGLVKDKADLGNRFYMKLRKWGRYVGTGDETPDDNNLGWGETSFTKIINSYIQDSTFPLKFYDEDDNLMPSMTLKEAQSMKGERGQMLIERARKIQRQNNNRMLTHVPKKFNNWVRTKASQEVRSLIETAYNQTYNAVINPPFDGRTLRVRGMSDTFYGVKDFTVYKHNRAIAEKLVWNGKGANCHDVGAGKTLASIITSQVLLQQGAARKPMFVVPGKVQEKWVEEYLMLFPDAKVLNMKMSGGDKHKELTMAQLYNWDAIFIADHAFKSLPLSPAEQARIYSERIDYFNEMLENFEDLLEEDQAISKAAKTSMMKRMEKQMEEWETKLRNVAHSKRLETDIFFDELGVDCLFFDEAHFYKNALGSAKAAKLGISANKPSQRAEDALQKTRWLFSKVGYKNVFVLTATPVVNSPVEVWHMLNLCAPDLLAKYEIENLDNFINLFVREEEKIVKKTNGEYRSERVVAGYYNLPEMRKIVDELMDIKSYDQLIGFYKEHPDYIQDENGQTVKGKDGKLKVLEPKFKRPKANSRNVIIEPSELHKLLFDDIILRANDVIACMKDRQCETKDNFLVITGDGSKIATDLRVYDKDFEGIDRSYLKLGAMVENVAASYGARSNPGPEMVSEDLYGDFFNRPGRERTAGLPPHMRSNPSHIEVITSKGVVKEKDGYWVVWNEKKQTYEPLHILEAQKPEHTWSEGIFGSEKEAIKRAQYLNERWEQIQANRSNPSGTAIRNQIIFCDWISLHNSEGGSFHQLIKSELVKAGIPKEQIAIINGSIIGTQKNGDDYSVSSKDDKEALKKEVQDDFNQGKYRVVIGNQSIAEGMNLQKWTTDMHHMDVPYTPSQIQQRNGRGLRQGNQYGEVTIHYYLMQDSFDQYRLELVSKKQSWIDDLFFGTGREVDTGGDSESLEYEQMVAATNSDPRVKEFFEALAQKNVLDDRISNLESEVQRLEASQAQAATDIEQKQQRMKNVVERESALQASKLPATAEKALQENLFQVQYGWNGEPYQLDIELSSDSKRISGYRMKTVLDVPENNANGRVWFHLIPDSNTPDRSFYNKQTWGSIKRMAAKELGESFGWTLEEKTGQGKSISGNLGNIVATEEDFYDEYGVDFESEKAKKDEAGNEQSFKALKGSIGMFTLKKWQPIITRKLAQLFLALENAWVRTAESRMELLKSELRQTEKTLAELQRVLASTKAELEAAKETREKNQKTVIELNDVVNQLVAVSYDDRNELYEEINRIAPKYKIRKTITVRDVGSLKGNAPKGAPQLRENKAGSLPGKSSKRQGVLKTLYEEPLVYSGIVKELEYIDEKGYMQRMEAEKDDLAMIINAKGTSIFVFPTKLMRLSKSAFNNEQAAEMFEEFHHFPADDYDYELFPPAGEKLLSAGYADRIMYVSDKVIYADDEKGKANHYFHYFDAGKRPVFKYGDVYIIANVNIDGRGILN